MGPEFQFMRALAGATKFFKAAKIAFYIYAGVSAVKSWREASALMKEGQDVLATKHPAGGKLPILYGTRRVGSTIVYMDTDSGNSKELFVVYALSVGEIDDIDLGSIELNGVSIRDSKVFRQGYYAGSDKIVSGAGSLNTASQIGNVQESNAGTSGTDPTKRYRMVFNAHHGSSTQTADPMLTASITKWTTSHRLRGIAYIAASFEYDSRGMFTSTPELTVVCRGKKLYDPRLDGSISGGTGSHRIDDTSTYEWSDNAALAILDYITNTEYGKGLAASAIDMSSFQAAANITDTKVDVPDFSGSYASATYTGNSGNNYFDVDEVTWKKIKGGSVITLKDSDTTTELEDAIVTDVQRYTPHTETTKYRIYTNSTLGANYSNEAGTILVKTRRFHCNGLLDADKTVLENTRTLVSNCRAFFNYLNGKFSIKIEDTGSSTFSITEDHIVDDSGITINYEDKAEKYNKVVVNFFNAQKKYEADTVTIYHDASPNYTSDDGGEELEAQAELNFVTNPYIAYNIGKAILGRSRNQKAISFTATPALFRLSVGDIVDITYSGLGLSADNYIIQSISLEANGLLNVTALEYVDIYTWDSASDAENVGDLPDLPTGLEARPPTNLTFTDSDSSSTGRPFLSWTAATNYPAKEFRVVIVDSSDNELHNRIVSNASIDLNFIPVGSNYEASVSSINSLGSESDAATLTFSVGTEPVATTDVQDSAVTTGKINDSAVTTGKINDSAVTSGKLADGAVTSLKLADDAVTNAKLAVDSIQGDVIAAGAITTTKLADDAVTNAKIAVDAIQGDVIAAGAITTTKLGANAVTTAKLANDAVTSDIIAASAVTTTEISDNAVSTAKLIAGSVTTAKIATGAVTANEIAANTITAGEIAAGAVNTSELAANAVTAAKIAANTITASQIAAGTITANEIATDTITAANIAAGAIDTSELAANAVTAAKIAANTITASQIAAGTITTTQIAAGTIAASNIAAGTLTSASGVFGAISAGDISTGSLTSTNHSGTGDGSDFSTAGTKINIADGSVSSENFRISSAGDAFFRGQVTAGSGVSTVAIGADSGSNINIFAGATTPDSATFKVDSTGKVTLTSLILKTGGNTYFDEDGFTDYAITQILQGTGTTVGSYAYSQSDNSAYATITTTDAVTVDLTASLDMTQILGDNSYSTSALAKAQIPEDITIIIEVAEDDNTFGSPLHGSTSSQFTADTTGVFQPDPSDGSGVTSSEYHVSAFGFFGIYTASISPTYGAVDGNSNMSVSLNNVSLSANTTYYFRFRLTTTDTNYDLENNLTIPTATRTLNISAQSGGFVVASGGGSGSGTSADSFQRISVSGQSTIIADATNSNNLTIAAGSGIALTTNASTDTLTIAASGSPTFTDLTVTGNLTVQGTTTTLETATLNVEDKNITLNYGSGDTSASANGAGITIQDAVNSTTDATILWDATNDEFDFSHSVTVNGDASIGGASGGKLTIAGQSINSFATTTEPSLYRTGSGGSDIFATAGNLVIQPRTSAARSVNIATSDNGTSTLKRASFASNGDISFYEDTGTTAKLFWDASTERLGIGTATPLDILHLSRAGASADARLVIDADTGYDAELKFSEGGTTKFTAGYDAATTSFVIGTTNVDTNKRFIINSSGNATFSGNVTATAFYGDGSNLTGVGGTTINSNADNRVITGSGTANTLNAESGLTYDGSTLAVSGAINVSGSSNITIGTYGTTDSGKLVLYGSTANKQADLYCSNGNLHIDADNGSGIYLNWYGSQSATSTAGTYFGNANAGQAARIDSSGQYYVGTTVVIDSSRNLTNIGTISNSGTHTITANSNAILMQTSSNPSNYYAYISANYSYAQSFSIKAKGGGNEYTLMDWGDGVGLEFHGGSTQNIKFSSHNLSSIGTITATGDINLTSTGTTSPAITFNTSSGTDASIDMAIRASGEGLDFYEPEDVNKVHMRIVDDSGVNAVYGLRTGTGDGTVRIDASGNLTNIGTISSGAITSTGYITSSNAKMGVWAADSGYSGIFQTSHGSTGYAVLFNATNTFIGSGTSGKVYIRYNNNTSTNQLVVGSSGWEMGSTVILDGSRNLTNIGTISSGAITVGGAETITSSRALHNLSGDIRSDNVFSFITQSTAAQSIKAKGLYVGTTYGGNTPSNGMVQASLGFAVGTGAGGTTVIDASRNLTNIGTISAGYTTLTASADAQLILKSPDTWTGIGFDDANAAGADYIWHNGSTSTFAIGGGGSAVSGKKLHVDGAMSVGSSSDATASVSEGIYSQGDIHASSGYLIMGEAAYSASANYVGIKTSFQSGTSDYMIISGKVDGSTYVSAKSGSNTHIRGGGNSNAHELVVSSSAATFGGTVQISASQKLLFNGTSNYGVGAGGHNYNSVYADTIESGSATDPLELVYYQGRGVNIGSGASKNLGCAGLGVGVADSGIRSGYMVHLKSVGDAAILIEADTDNITETDNAFIRFEQDGSLVAARVGFASGTNAFEIFNEYPAEVYLGTNNANRAVLNTSGDWTVTGNVTAYGSVSDIRRKENIEVIPNALDKVAKLDGVTFNFKDNKDTRMTGVIAQQVMEVLPEAVYEHETIEKEQTYAVHYGNMVGLLIEAIKEQQEQIEELKAKLDDITK
jgi:hypothetical protein